jgi:carbonic anhydrase
MININPAASIGRRTFLQGSALATAGVLAGQLPLSASTSLTNRGDVRPPTPEEALDRLMAGNRRFAAGESQGLHRDLIRVSELTEGQSPYAAVLSCADSRVPPELLFDQGFGDIFTVRVAGNVAGSEEIGSLEYTVGVLGSMVVMVLGHSSCGAVSAAMKGGPVPGQISALFAHITPGIADAGDDMDAAVAANVRAQARVLRTASPVMREAIAEGRLAIVGGVYDLHTGSVKIVDEG